MDTIRLGASGLEISRIVLGCMSYGDPGRGNHAWTLDLDATRPFFRRAVEAGITTSSRRANSFTSRPVISSLEPSEYTFAVSKVVIPASTARRKKGLVASRSSVQAWLPRPGSP